MRIEEGCFKLIQGATSATQMSFSLLYLLVAEFFGSELQYIPTMFFLTQKNIVVLISLSLISISAMGGLHHVDNKGKTSSLIT